ncbi:MAG: hypothetical protein AUK35_07570 [Zetaproteobacteria bacterium CG2_30_46_52]|nr:MAG: hypothetical protein AUK35_07570 [Zetaproteobacteria bacterium CG2_30_46_52]
MKWLDDVPYGLLIAAAILMALLPFQPQPHLLEKLGMLMDGVLNKPIDIFDLCWHLLPSLLLGLKFYRAKKSI